MEYAVHIGSGKVKISSVNKNILIIDDLLIKSIFLLPNYKYMNNQIKKFLKCIKHFCIGPVLSCCDCYNRLRWNGPAKNAGFFIKYENEPDTL